MRDGENYSVIGIAPPSLLVPTGSQLHPLIPFAPRIDIWKPIAPTPNQLNNESWDQKEARRAAIDLSLRRAEQLDQAEPGRVNPPTEGDPSADPLLLEGGGREILWACDLYPDNGQFHNGTPARLKALVLLMRYSGLRIGDAVTSRADRIVDGKLFLYTQGTRCPSTAR